MLTSRLNDALEARNARETVPFRRAFESHQRLLQANRALRRQTIEADKELIILRHKLSESMSPGLAAADDSEALRRVKEELSRLQGQVTDRYRSQAEHAAEQLRFMREAQLLQSELRAAKDALERLQLEHGETMAVNHGLEIRCEELQDVAARHAAEAESLRSMLSAAEERSVRLTAENHELIDRVVKEKSSVVDQVNRQNDEIASLRHQLGSARRLSISSAAAAGAGGPTGPTGVAALVTPAAEETWRGLPTGGPTGVPSRCLHSIPAHTGGANDVCLGEGGAAVATAGDDGTVRIWEAATAQQKAKLQSHGGGTQVPSIMAVDVHGDLVAAASVDNRCRVWNFTTAREVANLTGHHQKVVAARFCKDGRWLATGSHDCTVKVWDVGRQRSLGSSAMRTTSKVNALDADGSGGSIVTGHRDGGIKIWDVRAAQRAGERSGVHSDQISSVTFSPVVAHVLLTQGCDSMLKVLDLRTFGVLAVLRHPHFRSPTPLTRACFSPDGQHVAAGSADGGVYIWAVEFLAGVSELNAADAPSSGRVAAILETHQAPVVACHWGRGRGGQLASVDRSGGLALWS